MTTGSDQQGRVRDETGAPDLVAAHRAALEETRARVARVAPDQWTAATPDEEWDVRALVNHVVSGNLWAAELAAGRTIDEVGSRLDGDVLGADPLGAYDASAAVAAEAFATPGALDAPCAVSYGPVPGSVYAGHRIIDVCIHGWDIAVATGQDATIDPELVAVCSDIVAPQADMLRASGMFGDDLATAPGDDEEARLLAVLGRHR